MKPTDIWSRETRFVELDVQADSPSALLVRQGFTRLLAISASAQRLAAIALADEVLAGKLVRSTDPNVVARNGDCDGCCGMRGAFAVSGEMVPKRAFQRKWVAQSWPLQGPGTQVARANSGDCYYGIGVRSNAPPILGGGGQACQGRR